MKKFKKLLAGILAGAMMLGSMTATAFADEGGATTSTTMPTIDTTKTGSITIHKYTEGDNTGNPATGKEDADQVPNNAKPINDVGFTLYKVIDKDELLKYYNGKNDNALPSVSDCYNGDGTLKKTVTKCGEEKKTGKDGIAKFDSLELGIYLVVETSRPAIVTESCKPFLVSIPMTVDNNNWLYDVHVYPKNSTAVGKITLEKKGVNDVALKGVTFVLQKKTGTDENKQDMWTNIIKKSTEQGDNEGEALNLVTDKNGKITIEGLSSGEYRFIETSVWDAQNNSNGQGYIMDGATVYPFTVNGDNVTYINQKGEKNTGTNITITVNNEKPDMTKQVKKRTAETWGQDADYNVGDMVPYKITIDVPSNITKLIDFTLTDTPTNLDDKIFDENKNSLIEIKYNNSAIVADAYGVEKEGGHGFKITFIPAKMEAYAGKKLVITYNAELLNTAATTIDGNLNTAKLEYSNKILPGQDDKDNPNKPENPDTKPEKDSIEDKAIVYTFKLQVLKKAEKADGSPLKEVEFDLYKELPTGTTGAITGDAAKAVGLDSTIAWLKINKSPLTTDENGEASQSGLANGTYYLVETKTAEKYNLLKAPVQVTLNIQYTTSKTESWFWTTDNTTGKSTLVKHEINTQKTTFKEKSATSTEELVPSKGTHTETIINKKGFTLPTTGGMGTVIFSVLGIALVLAGLLVITASRKKAAK